LHRRSIGDSARGRAEPAASLYGGPFVMVDGNRIAYSFDSVAAGARSVERVARSA
jgi:hypothetical protein